VNKLTNEVILEKAENLLNMSWEIEDEKWLKKKYRFKNYLDGITFVNHIGHLSEEENHHPFISIDYKLVTIKLTSWKARGLTELDLSLASKYDQLYDDNV
jgi:4a-hydroxytetrahydrobiopterin dehydratase